MDNLSDKIDAIHKKEIGLIIKRMKNCPKDFECVTNRFEVFCKTKDGGDGASIRCVEVWSDCKFKNPSTEGQFFCRCPLRCYLHHKFED